ncbi:uncharacterized protein [Antedon mediterranea]|uniref:uncharacterized protein isoform X2 n=1 Tax=Antedon mediterranea TaxID=105859 RepID=UPI003AF7CB7A
MSKTPEAYGNTNGRQRLRPWLVHKINSGTIKGLEWMDEEKLMFKIPWKHAGKQDYDPEEDSRIFKEWSLHTGKYKITMEPEPAVWKTRLRTALNKLPDIEEVQDKTQLDIPEPYRVYRLLPRQKKPSSMPLTQRNNGCRSQVYHPYQRLDQTNQHPSRLSQMRHSMGYNRPNNVHTGYPTSYIMPGIDQMTPPGNSNDIFYDFQPQISQVFSPTSVGGLNIEDVNDVITPRLDPYMSDYDQMSAGSSSPNMDPEPQYQNNQLTQFNYTQGGIIASQPTMTSLQSRTYGGGYQHQTNNVYTTQAQGCAPTTAVGMTSSPAYNQTYHQQTHNAMVPYSGGMRAVDDIWPGTTVPVREDNMIMKTEKEMDIKVRYRGETVIDKRVGDCCIYSKTMLPGLELLTPIELPDSQTVEYKFDF